MAMLLHPSTAEEPPWDETVGSLIEASNPPVMLPLTTKQIKIVKMMKARLVIPNTRSCATLSLPASPFSVLAAGVPVVNYGSAHLQLP